MPSLVRTALLCRCPACGKGRVHAGWLRVAAACDACGQSFQAYEKGDGPAVLAILLVGCVVMGLALWVEFAYSPAWWMHVLVWPPVTLALSLYALRAIMALIIGIQHRSGGM